MAIQIRPKELRKNWGSKIRMFRDYLINRLYLQKINLKSLYLEAVALRFTFVWNTGEIKDRTKISTEFFFLKTVY